MFTNIFEDISEIHWQLDFYNHCDAVEYHYKLKNIVFANNFIRFLRVGANLSIVGLGGCRQSILLLRKFSYLLKLSILAHHTNVRAIWTKFQSKKFLIKKWYLELANFNYYLSNKAKFTDEGSYSAANSIGRKFLYNSRGLDVISLLVKYYVPLAHINKVIKFLKFKSAMNLQCWGGAIERAGPNEISQ